MKHWLFFSLLLHSALVSADALSDRLGGFAAIKELTFRRNLVGGILRGAFNFKR